MAFHDTKKNNGYHSLFIKLFGHVYGGTFFPDTVYILSTCNLNKKLYNWQTPDFKLCITV